MTRLGKESFKTAFSFIYLQLFHVLNSPLPHFHIKQVMALLLGTDEGAGRKSNAAKGKLRVGIIAHSEGAKASIPSRFETILNTGVRENDAFGRRTYRFNEAENELPGPGTYKARVSAMKTRSDCSFSKKGSATFVAKVGFPDDAPVQITPGPGAYEYVELAAASPTHKPSAAFAAPSQKHILRLARPPVSVPGPGTYHTEAQNRVPCAAMTSKSPRRTVTAPQAFSIGPGEYQSEQMLSTIKVHEPLKMSCFARSGVDRFGHSAAGHKVFPTVLPPLMQTNAYEASDDIPPVVVEVAQSAPAIGKEDKLPQNDKKDKKPSSMFSATNLDRFGRPIVHFTAREVDRLGPGSYNLETKQKRLLISSSWALSGVTRTELKDRYQPPGPAYYNPKGMSSHVSHRVSVTATWV